MRGILFYKMINCSGAMVEITPTEMTPPEDDSREFHPMRGVGNRHLQTMLPRLIRRKLGFTPHWQRLELRTVILSIWRGAKTPPGAT